MSSQYLTIVYTRFAGATNTKGSRIVATATYFEKRGKRERNYDHALSGDANHEAAAWAFMDKHSARPVNEYELLGVSDNPSGSGNAFVFKWKEI
jgi:hypothetical protein